MKKLPSESTEKAFSTGMHSTDYNDWKENILHELVSRI